jgi:putative FmdB family regulatory protein
MGKAIVIYEYVCGECGKKSELNRRVADRDNPARCACGMGDLTRTVTAPTGFVLKGAGFYKPSRSDNEPDS